ncbi:RagB/SusD family nutrient uptake outer membrane protein [Spirosoma fluviale]|uniref:Starch-binding associating with outer membrane n=1 Tax=Spirosoma fluviale TaxID=1597977 RepID=A0A286GAX6_9BACT|nr:RagB/SusD family nutrient uptake outer membrane protein [Spirosoma fluviale]SOD92675.1 Starch-binding associating with outer membrane [Spirosoma fluviale]
MKAIIKLIVVAVGLFTLAGCKEFLVEKTFTNLNQNIYPKSEGDLRVLCNGLYNMFAVNEHYGRSYLILSDVYSDELTTIALSGPRYEIQNTLITPANTELAMVWSRNFTIISRANVVVQQAPTAPLPEAKIQPFVAEARFIRALCYFELVKFFGDVPLIQSQPTNLDSLLALKPVRSPQKDIYKLMVDDLKFAETYLPKESAIPATYKGLASTGAASALLAKVYLTRAYLPFAEAADFQDAAAACAKVINSGSYDLFANYADVFDVTKKNGIEHIFSIQYDQAPNRSGAMTAFLTPVQVYPRSFGVFPAERKFYNDFPATDVIRKKFVFYDQGVGIGGASYNFLTTPTSTPFCAKYRDDVLAAASTNDRCNYLIVRFADVLLMHSEALNRVNAAEANKYTGINRVRARVKLPPLSGLDQAAFENAVLDERHWELCFEGKRRDDIIRMGKFVSILTAAGNTNVKEFNRYYPVPQSEIDINTNLKQNTGY